MNERPEISLTTLWLWNAFWELSNARRRSFGLEPLSYGDIHSYCVLNGYDRMEAEELCGTVKAMDLAYIEILNKKAD